VVSVQHPSTGPYRLDFPAGTWAGSTGRFILATVSPVTGQATWIDHESAIAPIAADASASLEVEFASSAGHVVTLFIAVVGVTP
jgi:hypothetical protein